MMLKTAILATLAFAIAAVCVLGSAAAAAPLKLKATINMIPCGPIILQLLPEAAPKTVTFWSNLVTSGWYNSDSSKHANRWIYRYASYNATSPFVLQGGGYNDTQSGVPDEATPKFPNVKYTVAMARDNDPSSGGSEFFINLNNNSAQLDPNGRDGSNGYAVFAKVVGGFSAIECLQKLPHYHSNSMGMTTFYQPWPLIKDIALSKIERKCVGGTTKERVMRKREKNKTPEMERAEEGEMS